MLLMVLVMVVLVGIDNGSAASGIGSSEQLDTNKCRLKGFGWNDETNCFPDGGGENSPDCMD